MSVPDTCGLKGPGSGAQRASRGKLDPSARYLAVGGTARSHLGPWCNPLDSQQATQQYPPISSKLCTRWQHPGEAHVKRERIILPAGVRWPSASWCSWPSATMPPARENWAISTKPPAPSPYSLTSLRYCFRANAASQWLQKKAAPLASRSWLMRPSRMRFTPRLRSSTAGNNSSKAPGTVQATLQSTRSCISMAMFMLAAADAPVMCALS
mmetsp:Transcript_113432/g.315867  ORF Transcript_113432/g.315867 Transcript_113432/m.315867 type:complete len:211 (+) Transcript_113432:1482-2114(+)